MSIFPPMLERIDLRDGEPSRDSYARPKNSYRDRPRPEIEGSPCHSHRQRKPHNRIRRQSPVTKDQEPLLFEIRPRPLRTGFDGSASTRADDERGRNLDPLILHVYRNLPKPEYSTHVWPAYSPKQRRRLQGAGPIRALFSWPR